MPGVLVPEAVDGYLEVAEQLPGNRELLANHLDDSWKPIVDADIAGETSTANVVDSDIKILGRSMATKRAARCVFLGTAPMANLRNRDGSAATIRGIEQKRVVLGSTYPGDNPAHVADGLRRLGDLGKYMNRDQDRYWLSLQQTVAQIVQELIEAACDSQPGNDEHDAFAHDAAAELENAAEPDKDQGVAEPLSAAELFAQQLMDGASAGDLEAVSVALLGLEFTSRRMPEGLLEKAFKEACKQRCVECVQEVATRTVGAL